MRCGRLSDMATPRVPDRQDSSRETASAHARPWAAARALRIAFSARGPSAPSVLTSRETTGGPRPPARTTAAGRSQHRDIGQGVPAQRQHHHQVRNYLPRVVHGLPCRHWPRPADRP